MKKEALLSFLNEQINDINIYSFDLDILKSTVSNVLLQAFGKQSSFYKQVSQLEYIEKNSLEELYPKTINDIPASKEKTKKVLQNIVQQLNLMDESEFGAAKDLSEKIVLEQIQNAINNHLNGKQIEQLKTFVLENKSADKIVEHIRNYESDTTLNILAELLAIEDLWN